MSDPQTTLPATVTEAARPETVPVAASSVPVVRLRDPNAATEGSVPDLPTLPAGLAERYELLGEVGKGGMGVVLRGRDPAPGRELAIKVLLEKYADRPDLVRRFCEEAQVGGQLQHPGVVPVHELGVSGGQPYFTMKLVKGTTLDALLRQRPDPEQDQPRFLKVFEAVCQTVAYAHSRGVIHRDLKPANIMVGAFGEVQVMDWGLAKVLPQGAAAAVSEAAETAGGFEITRAKASDFGTQDNDVEKLTRASAEADKALKIARGGAGAAIHEEADQLHQEIEQRLDQANRNETLLAALLDVHLPHAVALAAGVREAEALASLSEKERELWLHLWADVAALLTKVQVP